MPTQIEHLVVLMLENRSFDHMLGFLTDENPNINGLKGDEWNYPAEERGRNVAVSREAADVHDLNPDPNHEFDHVTSQISSTGDPVGNPDMKGFVRDYYTQKRDAQHATNIMKCFTPSTLPVLSTLANQYGVSDRWFSSVPGSTIPNRLFVHGASSAGSITQDAIAGPYELRTIFESFDATTSHDYAIYTAGASVLLANHFLVRHQEKFFDYANFGSDARHGDLPAYTFIEPSYDDDGEGTFASSQHPDFPVDRGEALIREIYNALTQSPGWKSTLFLILYDEHGGIFDHVPPPILKRDPKFKDLPDVPPSPAPHAFDFMRLGVRVPAVFISPCIRPHTIINDRDYEHSSVVATVRNLFCPKTPRLTWREAQAPTFEDVLSLTGHDIRTDVVNLPEPGTPVTVGPLARNQSDLSVLMAGAMQYSLEKRGLTPPGDFQTLTDSRQVLKFLRKAQEISANAAGAQ